MTCKVWRSLVGCGCWLLAFLLFAGCGGPAKLAGSPPQPVHGRVLYQGKPAAGFRVSFNPLAEQEGPRFAPAASTNENGEFQLRSYHENDGAPAGEYVVTFAWPKSVSNGDPDDAPTQIDRLRGSYSDPKKSQFKITVREGENTLE